MLDTNHQVTQRNIPKVGTNQYIKYLHQTAFEQVGVLFRIQKLKGSNFCPYTLIINFYADFFSPSVHLLDQ
jgi:hypothetical protein